MKRVLIVAGLFMLLSLTAALGFRAPVLQPAGCYALTTMQATQSRLTDQIIIDTLPKLVDSAAREPAMVPTDPNFIHTEIVCGGQPAVGLISDYVNVWVEPDTKLSGPQAERLSLAMQGLYADHVSAYSRLQQTGRVSLSARDLEVDLSPSGDELDGLLSLLKEVVPTSLASPLPGVRYPYLQIAGSIDSQPYLLTLNTPAIGYDSDGTPHSLPPELWPYLMDLTWIPPERADSLRSLFLAEKATLFGFQGPDFPLSSDLIADSPDSLAMLRFHSILRELLKGEPRFDLQSPPAEPLTTLVFEMQDGHQRVITLGRDWFEYQEVIYRLDDLPERLHQILSAS